MTIRCATPSMRLPRAEWSAPSRADTPAFAFVIAASRGDSSRRHGDADERDGWTRLLGTDSGSRRRPPAKAPFYRITMSRLRWQKPEARPIRCVIALQRASQLFTGVPTGPRVKCAPAPTEAPLADCDESVASVAAGDD